MNLFSLTVMLSDHFFIRVSRIFSLTLCTKARLINARILFMYTKIFFDTAYRKNLFLIKMCKMGEKIYFLV